MCACIALVGPRTFPFELTTHFPAQYLGSSLVSALAFFLLRNWKLLALALGCIVISLLLLLPSLRSNDTKPLTTTTSSEFSVLLSNVQTSNQRFNETIDTLLLPGADILVLLEIDDLWSGHLSRLDSQYPYRERVSREDNFGIAVFSKFPLQDSRSAPLGAEQPPSIISNVLFDRFQLNLIATHPVPPMSTEMFKLRNEQLEDVGKVSSRMGRRTLVVGDLNTSSWSPYFRDLLRTSRLEDSRQGRGIYPTWPRHVPFLYIPIDHCLASSDLRTTSVSTIAIPGSDHLALLVHFDLSEI